MITLHHNDIATVGELVAALEQYDPATPVRLATQPGYPLENLLGRVADLGEYLDPDGEIWSADEARDESLHQPGCAFALSTLATPGEQS